ncbi:P-loop containing nucleoside triphosphate hydrolase protein [Amylocarpus encephaloides]|uniref:P-loop containing nucleoside triphosphate hydrolase protein n=1 Tax=Amylocarpus encephaloides TaxID=45428 RepID=A0A9P7YEQ9_9HELO|nr:P-loop containing nucleoside triphosphate hydrolase protein [Amylocarpus encephaloides]
MSSKPIFVATHPRACSTAFERVFMTRRDILTCVHEPFGDAFYFGPERLSPRYENDQKSREESGFAGSTYKTIFERIEKEGKEGKRLFIKDITHYLAPPEGQRASIAPSLGGQAVKKGVGTNDEANGVSNGVANGAARGNLANGNTHGHAKCHANGHSNGTNGHSATPYPYATVSEPGNPTVVPGEILKQFHFTFLIRHPRHSIPSYFRCTIPPLDSITGFYNFMPDEAGYDELRRVFDFLKAEKQVGPALATLHNGDLPGDEVSITVIDADDLLDNPEGIIKAYCKEVGIEYSPNMLIWDTEDDHQSARDAFEKWRGFHEDAINSTCLKPRSAAHKKKHKTVEIEDKEWREKYGDEGAKVIRETVTANIPDYEYLKSFAIKV